MAWAAGIFDGEGHAGITRKSANSAVMRIIVGQKDRRLLDRFQTAIGFGKIYELTQRGKKVYTWQVSKFEHGQAFIALVWAWLSPVKREQVKTCLLAMKEHFAYRETVKCHNRWR